MLRYSPCEVENKESEIGGGDARKTKTCPLLIRVSQPNVPTPRCSGSFSGWTSQGIFKVSEHGIDAMRVPGVKCGRGHSLKIESAGRVRGRTCSMENRGRGSKEDGREQADGNADEGPRK